MTRERIAVTGQKGTLWSKQVVAAGLLRPAAITELAYPTSDGHADYKKDRRKWLCVMEASGLIMRYDVEITEAEAQEHGHLPSFWARKWRDAFHDMLNQALLAEGKDAE
jgi:hypothetical protein